MTLTERRIGTRALQAVLAALLTAGQVGTGEAAADLRQKAGALSANAADQVEGMTFGPALRACFAASTAAGATFEGMDCVRTEAASYAIDSLSVQRVTETCVRFALVEMSRIVAGLTFASRGEVETMLARLNAAFEPSEEFAADRRNASVYRAILGLHAAVVRDLSARSRPLPRIVTFDLGSALPALTIANRLYGDAERTDDLLRENRTRHPLFMNGAGRALSA